MSVSPIEYLHHIVDEIAFLMDRAVGLELDDLFCDEVLQRAFVRSLQIIGEPAMRCRSPAGSNTRTWSGEQLLVCAIG